MFKTVRKTGILAHKVEAKQTLGDAEPKEIQPPVFRKGTPKLDKYVW